jgi:hypothetical protein
MFVTELLLAIIAILLGGIGYFVKEIFDKTDKLEKDFQPISPAIIEIQHKFTEAGHSLIYPLTVKPGSPLELTEYGAELMRKSGFNKILANEKNRKTLVGFVKAMNPQTNYDIQECSLKTINELLDKGNPMLNPLKDYAFNSGMPLHLITQPAGVLLRDEVLKKIKL